MNYTLFAFCANVFGFIAGGISLLGFAVAVCRPHLPSNKIKTLETLLHETENTFGEAIEAGLLVPEFIVRIEENLTGLKEQTYNLRAHAYNPTILSRDYAQFLRISNAIGRTYQSVKKLQAEVITSSEERRRRLRQMNSHDQPAPSAPHPSLVTQYPPTPMPPTDIVRPRSCPPAL